MVMLACALAVLFRPSFPIRFRYQDPPASGLAWVLVMGLASVLDWASAAGCARALASASHRADAPLWAPAEASMASGLALVLAVGLALASVWMLAWVLAAVLARALVSASHGADAPLWAPAEASTASGLALVLAVGLASVLAWASAVGLAGALVLASFGADAPIWAPAEALMLASVLEMGSALAWASPWALPNAVDGSAPDNASSACARAPCCASAAVRSSLASCTTFVPFALACLIAVAALISLMDFVGSMLCLNRWSCADFTNVCTSCSFFMRFSSDTELRIALEALSCSVLSLWNSGFAASGSKAPCLPGHGKFLADCSL